MGRPIRSPEANLTSHLIPSCADRPGDDPIFSLNAEANRRAAQGEDVLNSTLGALMKDDGAMAVMPSVFEAFQRISPEAAAAYAPISGPPAFLDAVIEDLFGSGPLASSAVGAATPGGTGACYQAIVNFLEPGQKLLTTSFYWGPYRILAEHSSRGIETFEMFSPDGSFHCEALGSALDKMFDQQGRVLLVLNTPCHNPTGFSLDDKDWNDFVTIARRAAKKGPLTVLFDFAYAKFASPGSIRWPRHVGRLQGEATLVFAWSASKAFAQYGARVGACIAIGTDEKENTRLRNALGFSCRGTWSNCNHLGMLAITELLCDPDLRQRSDAERDMLRSLLSERVDAFNELARARELAYPRYEGGFFVTVFSSDAKRVAASMREEGVYVVPVEGGVRVAICSTPTQRMEQLVDALVHGVAAAGVV